MNVPRAIIPKAPLVNASLLVVAILGVIALATFLVLPADEAGEFSIYLGSLGVLVVIYLAAFSRSRAYQYQRPTASDLPKMKWEQIMKDSLKSTLSTESASQLERENPPSTSAEEI